MHRKFMNTSFLLDSGELKYWHKTSQVRGFTSFMCVYVPFPQPFSPHVLVNKYRFRPLLSLTLVQNHNEIPFWRWSAYILFLVWCHTRRVLIWICSMQCSLLCKWPLIWFKGVVWLVTELQWLESPKILTPRKVWESSPFSFRQFGRVCSG